MFENTEVYKHLQQRICKVLSSLSSDTKLFCISSRKLLQRCSRLQHLTLGRGVSVCDEDVVELVNHGVLNNLETLTITESDNKELTIAGVDYLIDHCPLLKHVTELRYETEIAACDS